MSAVGQKEFFFLYSKFLGRDAPFPACVVGGSAAAYLLFVFVIFPLTKPKTEEAKARAQSIRQWHNIALCAFSFLIFVATLYHLYSSGELFSLQPMVCNLVPEWIWYLNLVFTISKIWEWGDTMFLVWFDKPLQFLHIYHHTTTFWLYLHMTTLPGMLKMGLLLNGFVHTLMYLHYYRPFPKPLVPMITFMQICQLGFGTWVWHITPDTCPRYATFHKDYPYDFITPYLFAPVYLLFFVKLFVQRFVFGGGKKKKIEGGSPKVGPKVE